MVVTALIVPTSQSRFGSYMADTRESSASLARLELGLQVNSLAVGSTTLYKIEKPLARDEAGYLQRAKRLIARSAALGEVNGEPLLDLDYLKYLFEKTTESARGGPQAYHEAHREWLEMAHEDFVFVSDLARVTHTKRFKKWYVDGKGGTVFPLLSRKRFKELDTRFKAEKNYKRRTLFTAAEHGTAHLVVSKVAAFKGIGIQELIEDLVHEQLTRQGHDIANEERQQVGKYNISGLITVTLMNLLQCAYTSAAIFALVAMATAFKVPTDVLPAPVDLKKLSLATAISIVVEHLGIDMDDFVKILENENANGVIWKLAYIIAFNKGDYTRSFGVWQGSATQMRSDDARRSIDGVITKHAWTTPEYHAVIGHSVQGYDSKTGTRIGRRLLRDLFIKSLISIDGEPVEGKGHWSTSRSIQTRILDQAIKFGFLCVENGINFNVVLNQAAQNKLKKYGLKEDMTVEAYLEHAASLQAQNQAQWITQKMEIIQDQQGAVQKRKMIRPAPAPVDVEKTGQKSHASKPKPTASSARLPSTSTSSSSSSYKAVSTTASLTKPAKTTAAASSSKSSNKSSKKVSKRSAETRDLSASDSDVVILSSTSGKNSKASGKGKGKKSEGSRKKRKVDIEISESEEEGGEKDGEDVYTCQ